MNTVQQIVTLLLRDGRVRRSVIGLGGQDVALHRRIVRYFNLEQSSGVLATYLQDPGPAKRAGIQEGDILLSLENTPAPTVDALHRLLTESLVGKPVPLTLLRGTELLHLQITPEEAV